MEDQRAIDRLLQVIQAEYRESPGLNLTRAQMRKLWGIDASLCDAAVDALVRAHVLRRTLRDTFVLPGSSF